MSYGKVALSFADSLTPLLFCSCHFFTWFLGTLFREFLKMVNADAAGDSGKPVLSVHIESKSKCIGDLELGVDCPWSVETSAAETQFTTTGWNAQPTEPSYTTNTPINPLYPPNGHISSQSQNSSPTTTTQTQDPTPSSSTSETTTAPTLASIGTVTEATRNNGGSGLSSGAVAGIAIGTLIIGAALAFLAAFFLFKRRNKQQQREVNVSRIDYTSYADSTPELVMLQQKGAIVGGLGGRHSPYVQVSQTPIPTPAPVQAQKSAEEEVVALLPPPVGEACVGGRFAALFEEIHRHVETYYRDVHASITPSMEPDLAKFGAEDVDMAKLLHDCSSPTTALKHALVAYVLGITAPKKEGEGKTLFPEELGGMCSSSQADDGSGITSHLIPTYLTNNSQIQTSQQRIPSTAV
jgi:hypothetical protein